jgi:uncharacterized protein (DUF488 family)
MSGPTRVLTIGFTGTSAEHFFGRLRSAKVRRVLDVRLNNVSQLSGFAKRADLEWFLRTIGSIDYVHAVDLAPTAELLTAVRQRAIPWEEYARKFVELMKERRVEDRYARADLDHTALLCSEPGARACHRLLVAEHFQRAWDDVLIVHL